MSPTMIAVLGGGAVLAFVVGLWFPTYVRSRAVQRRTAEFVSGGNALAENLGGRRRMRGLRRRQQGQGGTPILRGLQTKLSEAAVDLAAEELLVVMAVLAVILAAIVLLATGSILVAALVLPLGFLLPFVWLNMRRGRRQKRFVAQLPDTVALLASSVRVGHSLLQGLENVAREGEEPTRSAFALVVREIGLGAPQEEALARLAERFPSEDIDLVVTAIGMHQQTGGSLARLLDTMVQTLRERIRLQGDIRALTSQQRYSAYILALLPVMVAIALFFISPDYVAAFSESRTLLVALIVAGFSILVGFFLMQKVASIDV